MSEVSNLRAPAQSESGGGNAEKRTFSFSPSLAILSSANGPEAEAIRALRTRIMAQHIDRGRRSLAICAPSAGAGCTYTAANLAVALSQVGVNTLLIDGNMRRSGLDALIRPSAPCEGLKQSLGGPFRDFADVIQQDVLPNLSVMYSGGSAPNAQELLASERFRSLAEFCLREFEATIVDTPAANTCSDATRVSTVLGYSLIVARRNATLVGDVKTLVHLLQADGAQVVGTVLNEA